MSKRAIEHEVLMKSKRRCCFCFGLQKDFAVKKGQIAHLDQDRTNDLFDNLVWMCLDHHDEFDSRTSQSRGLTERAATDYRDALYRYYDEEPTQQIEFAGRLQYEPASSMDYEARENTKRLAYGLMRSPIKEDKRTGLLMLIEVYFHRESQNAVPGFTTYVAHWLHANEDFNPDLVKDLVAEYGVPKHPRIKQGYSSGAVMVIPLTGIS